MESVRATVVEGKEAATEKMTMVKDTVVEKVYSGFYFTLMVAIGVNSVPMKVKTSTWFGFATSGEGEFDESQVVVINQKSLVIRLKENLSPLQVRMAIVFYSMLGIAIFLLLSLLVFKFIRGGPSRKTKKISSTLESSDSDSGEDEM